MNITLLPILLKIHYNLVDATHNLRGLVLTFVEYTSKYGTVFKRPTHSKLYTPTITATMSNTD